MTTTPAATTDRSLTTRVVAGVRWGALDVIFQQIMRLGVAVVLTRLIAPNDFGLLGMALVFTQFASLVGDLGLGPAIVQRSEITRAHISTAFTVTMVAGCVFTLIFWALSAPIAAFYNDSDLQPVIAALSLTYFLRGFAGIPKDLIRRSMNFRALMIISSTAAALGGFAGIYLAINGHGIWALTTSVLVENVAISVFSGVLSWRLKLWRPAFGFDKTAFNELKAFGVYVSGTRLMYYGASNLDNFIVGKVLGSTALGLYNLAYRVMLFPVLRVAEVVANVTMPAMARVQDDQQRLANALAKSFAHISVICFPVSVLACIAAPALIPTLFGSNWTAAIVVVQILALNGLRLVLTRMSGVVYEAIGRPQIDFAMLSGLLTAYVFAFILGTHWGIEGVAWAYTIVGFIYFPIDQIVVSRALNTTVWKLLRGTIAASIATTAMAFTALLTMGLTANRAPTIRTIAVVFIAVVNYLIALYFVDRKILKSTIAMWTQKKSQPTRSSRTAH